MFLFVVIGFMPRTSCILICLFMVVCRGSRWFCEHGVHLRKCWQFHFSMCFRTSVACVMSTSCCCVCFTSGFVLYVPATECVHV